VTSPHPAQHSRPLWVAALVSALFVPVAFFCALLAVNAVRGEASGESTFRGIGFVFLFGLPLSLGATYLVGLPFALLLRSQRLLTVKYVVAGAALLGAFAIVGLTFVVLRAPVTLDAVAVGVAVGAIAGLVFCATAGVAFRRSAMETES
jgi:hypothetical protein